MSSIYQHTAGDRTPYTYLIGWPHLNKWYYGSRYAKKCHPDDLFSYSKERKTYMTSSYYVKEFIKEHGVPTFVQIRKVFSSPDEALSWEKKVLRRLDVLDNDKWLNHSNVVMHKRAKPFIPSEEHRKIISDANKGKPKSAETKQKLREARLRFEESIKDDYEYQKTRSVQRKLTYQNLPETIKRGKVIKQSSAIRGRKRKDVSERNKIVHAGKVVTEETIDKLKQGWKVNGHPCIGLCWVKKDSTSIKIHKSELEDYENLGWTRGRHKRTK